MASSEEIGKAGETAIDRGIDYKRHAADSKTLKDEQAAIPTRKLLEHQEGDPTKSKRVFGALFFYYWELTLDADREDLDILDLVKISPDEVEDPAFDDDRIAAISIERKNPNTGVREVIHFFSDRMDIYAQGILHLELNPDGSVANEVGRQVFDPPSTTGGASETSVEHYFAEWATINPAVTPMPLAWVKSTEPDNSIFKAGSMDIIYKVLRDNMLLSGNEGERQRYSNEIES